MLRFRCARFSCFEAVQVQVLVCSRHFFLEHIWCLSSHKHSLMQGMGPCWEQELVFWDLSESERAARLGLVALL